MTVRASGRPTVTATATATSASPAGRETPATIPKDRSPSPDVRSGARVATPALAVADLFGWSGGPGSVLGTYPAGDAGSRALLTAAIVVLCLIAIGVVAARSAHAWTGPAVAQRWRTFLGAPVRGAPGRPVAAGLLVAALLVLVLCGMALAILLPSL